MVEVEADISFPGLSPLAAYELAFLAGYPTEARSR
jgi:hypothetical protein